MKYTLTLIPILFICFIAGAQSANDGHNHDTKVAVPALVAPPVAKKEDVIKFTETEHNFGKIPQGKPVYYNFEIVNTGIEPLKLDNVTASCGCTTPEWSHEEIAAGTSSIIKVGYNASAEGPFEKYITITYSGSFSKQIKIMGQVWKAPEGAAPANTSVQFLKKQSL
jgi:Protein of unknown function (DUF1573)